MIILGIILLVVGYLTGISIVYSIGGLLVLVGVILWARSGVPSVAEKSGSRSVPRP